LSDLNVEDLIDDLVFDHDIFPDDKVGDQATDDVPFVVNRISRLLGEIEAVLREFDA
jgi:hypothetical protein